MLGPCAPHDVLPRCKITLRVLLTPSLVSVWAFIRCMVLMLGWRRVVCRSCERAVSILELVHID
jgi:hypothetical protein